MTHWGIVWCVVSKVRAQRSDYYLKQNLSCCAPWKLHKDWNLLKQVLSIWKALMQWSVGCCTWRDQKKKAQSLSIPASCVAVADVATTIPRTVNSSIQHATIVPKKGDIALACRAKKWIRCIAVRNLWNVRPSMSPRPTRWKATPRSFNCLHLEQSITTNYSWHENGRQTPYHVSQYWSGCVQYFRAHKSWNSAAVQLQMVCGDFKVTITSALEASKYPLPKPADLFAILPGGKKFTKLDFCQSYQQLTLDEMSRKLVTVNTHCGLFQYTCLLLEWGGMLWGY